MIATISPDLCDWLCRCGLFADAKLALEVMEDLDHLQAAEIVLGHRLNHPGKCVRYGLAESVDIDRLRVTQQGLDLWAACGTWLACQEGLAA